MYLIGPTSASTLRTSDAIGALASLRVASVFCSASMLLKIALRSLDCCLRSADALVAPAMVYWPYELKQGLGDKGGIYSTPVAQMTASLVINRDLLKKKAGTTGIAKPVETNPIKESDFQRLKFCNIIKKLKNDVVNPNSVYQWRRQYIRENKYNYDDKDSDPCYNLCPNHFTQENINNHKEGTHKFGLWTKELADFDDYYRLKRCY